MLFFSRGFRTQSLSRPHVTSSRSTLKVASRRIAAVCVALLCSAWLVLPARSAGRGAASSASLRPTLPASYGKLPLSFEPNLGQTDGEVKFISRGPGYTLFLTPTEAVFSLQNSGARKSEGGATAMLDRAPRQPAQDAVLRVRLVGANPHAPIAGADALPGKTNYIRGNDPAKWITNIPGYASIHYSGVFPGTDLVYYGNHGHLEYDFVVSPGADPASIALNFSGARQLRVDGQTGDLVMKAGKEEIRFHKPLAYQNEAYQNESAANSRQLVDARYVINARNQVSFALGNYDLNRRLVIDPTLAYSTYLGGSSNDYATAIAVDNQGDAYVTGYTNSVNFPTTTGAYQTACSGGCSGTTTDAFVSKLDPTGSFLVYSTYLGGSANDQGNGIALDSAGDAYIAGQTFSSNFPVTRGAFQTKCGGGSCSKGDGFITELNPEGSALVYSTYLGGSGVNQANALVLDPSNNAYITGFTQSLEFPVTPNAFQATCNCQSHSVAFVTKLNSTGTALVYSTYLGGTNTDVGYSIALDSSNNAYLTGYTHSTNFPVTAGAFQTTLNAPTGAWVTKMNSLGTALVWSTYLGGVTTINTPCEACATAIAVDSGGNAYVCGLTAEDNFPVTPGAYQTTFVGPTNGHDAFLTKLNPSGSEMVFSTYLGGNGDTGATGIGIDQSGNIWLKGNTKSAVFPVTPGAFQLTLAGQFDAYISEIDPTGSQLLYSSYIGGTGTEYGGATAVLALDQQSPPNVYMTGYTNSTDYPVIAGSLQTQNAGENDGFVSKFSPSPNVGLSAGLNFGYQSDGTTTAPQILTLTNTGNTTLNVSAVNITGPNAADFAQTSNCGTVAPQSTCPISVTFTPSIVGTETANVSLTDNAPGSPQIGSLTGIGLGQGPFAVFSPASLNFGTVLIATTSAPQSITLSNVGNLSLTVSKIVASASFTETNNCGSRVVPGGSCTITVTFKPTKPNGATGGIMVTDNAVGSPQSASLTGTGTYMLFTPASLNFGNITVGNSSTPQTITVTNTAKTSMTMKTIALTGTNAGDFSQTNNCGSALAAGASCTITVKFTPTQTGLRSADVSVTDSGGGSPQLVPLTGTGQ